MAEDNVDFKYQPASTGKRRKKPKKTPAGLIAVVVVVIVLGTIGVIAVVMNSNKSEPPAVNTKHNITGGVWVADKQGGSQIMRGVDVYLYPPQLDAETAKNILLDQKNNWIDAINRDRLKVEQDKAAVAQQDQHKNLFDGYQALLTVDEKRWKEEQTGLEKIDEAIHAMTGPMPVREMYQKASFLAMNPPPLFRCGNIAVGKTSVDGKFTFEGIADGSYFLCAGVSNDVLHAEWCVAVTVSGTDLVQDLGDSNAEPTAHKFK